MDRRRVIYALLVALTACATLLATTANRVSINWAPNTNYSTWEEKHDPFYKGNWLDFGYLEVQIFGNLNSLSYAFELNETKTYYFICNYGYCYGGIRLAIKAQKLPPLHFASDRFATAGLATFVRSHAALVYTAVVVLVALLRMV